MTTLNGVFLRLLHFVFCVFVEFMKNVQQFEGIMLFFCTNKVLKDKLAKNLSYFCTVWSVSLQKIWENWTNRGQKKKWQAYKTIYSRWAVPEAIRSP